MVRRSVAGAAVAFTVLASPLAAQKSVRPSSAPAASGPTRAAGADANAGTFSDAQGNSTVTISASVGAVTKNDALGTWSWTHTPNDGPAEIGQDIRSCR